MRIVVTGASGVIGRSLLAAGTHAGHSMVGVSRSFGGSDVLQVDNYRKVPEGDVIVHLAQPANRNMVDAQSVRAATELFEDICGRPWRRIVYASSAAIYGAVSGNVREDLAIRGKDPYTSLKLACEAICLRHNGVVLRLSNILSDPPARNTVCADIIDQIPGDGPLFVRNAAAQLDLLWVQDAAQGIVSAAVDEAVGVFHLAYGQSVDIRQIAQSALAGAGESDRSILSRVDVAPSPIFSLDVSGAKHRLGWSPKIDPLAMIAAMAKQRTARSHD